MAIKYKDMKPSEACYHWISDTTGRNVLIATHRLYQWVMANQDDITLQLVVIDKEFADSFVVNRQVDPLRALQLIIECEEGKRKLDPIIMCKCKPWISEGPDALLCDGRHRYWSMAQMGQLYIPAFILELHQWMPYRIVGAPPITQDQLRNIPLNPRNY